MRSIMVALALLVSAASPVRAEVQMLRGSVPREPSLAPQVAAPRARADDPVIVAGNRLWLVDRTDGRIVACRQIKTSTVDGWRIRCSERGLGAGRTP